MKKCEVLAFTVQILLTLSAVSGQHHELVNSDDSLTSLPKTLNPTLYYISLILIPDAEEYLGTVNITFDVLDNQTAKDIYLNVDPNYLYVEEVLINNMMRPRLGKPNENNILDVNFTLGISGENNTISILFIGNYSSDYGLVRTNYTDGGEELFVIESQFETGYASRAFPCMDEADFVANFSLEIQYPKNYNATTNTEVLSEDCTTSVVIAQYAVTDKISPDSLYIRIEPLESNSSDAVRRFSVADIWKEITVIVLWCVHSQKLYLPF